MFNAERIKELTQLTDVLVLEEVDSTNTFLKNNLKDRKEGALVIAKRQTNGRGRLNRTFVSEKNGLYMSLLLKPDNDDLTKITAMAAVAVLRAVKKFTKKDAKIKWVNDIYVNHLKVAGILTEAVFFGNKLEYLVLGIGVNLVKPENDLDESIKNIAGYLFEQDTGIANEFVSEIINQFYNVYKNGNFIGEYRENSYLTGKTVTYLKDEKMYIAKVIDINDDCALVVSKDGVITTLISGEVSIKGFWNIPD